MSNEYMGFDLLQTKSLENLLAEQAATIATLTTTVTNLNTWAIALATKLNADAGVTDVNYDTNPQA